MSKLKQRRIVVLLMFCLICLKIVVLSKERLLLCVWSVVKIYCWLAVWIEVSIWIWIWVLSCEFWIVNWESRQTRLLVWESMIFFELRSTLLFYYSVWEWESRTKFHFDCFWSEKKIVYLNWGSVWGWLFFCFIGREEDYWVWFAWLKKEAWWLKKEAC